MVFGWSHFLSWEAVLLSCCGQELWVETMRRYFITFVQYFWDNKEP